MIEGAVSADVNKKMILLVSEGACKAPELRDAEPHSLNRIRGYTAHWLWLVTSCRIRQIKVRRQYIWSIDNICFIILLVHYRGEGWTYYLPFLNKQKRNHCEMHKGNIWTLSRSALCKSSFLAICTWSAILQKFTSHLRSRGIPGLGTCAMLQVTVM